MRVTHLRRTREEGLDVTLTPMIDVVFLLLVFFVWTVSFQAIEYILPSRLSAQMGDEPLPPQEVPPQMDFAQAVIRIAWIDAAPRWTINDVPIPSSTQLGHHLSQMAAVKNDASLILYPDPAVPLGYVIEAYDLARLAGFIKISFAVDAG